MKKILVLVMVIILFNVSYENVKGDVYEQGDDPYIIVARQYHKTLSKVKKEWNGTYLDDPVDLLGNKDECIAHLYRVFKENTQMGYFVVMRTDEVVEVIEAKFSGSDSLDSDDGNNYYVAPFGFYTKSDFNTIQRQKSEVSRLSDENERTRYDINEEQTSLFKTLSSIPTIDRSKLIPVSGSYVTTNNYYYYAEIYVNTTPEYFNAPIGPVANGCGPTTVAMLTSYYDRIALPNLYNGVLPLNHIDFEGNPIQEVNDHIVEMADYMDICDDIYGDLLDPLNCGSTTSANTIPGLNDYFDDKGYGQYHAVWDPFFQNYDDIILEGNVAYVSTTVHEETYSYGHAVLGIGIAYVYQTGTYMIVRYNHTDKSGEYHISASVFNSFTYMTE